MNIRLFKILNSTSSAKSATSGMLRFSHIWLTLTAIFAFAGITSAASDSAPRYALNSVLADGNWKKVKVAKTGMQFISTSSLRSMGFSDPSKVNVYGSGGRQILEKLSPSDPDDLPILPIVRTSRGIYFFGFDHIRWEKTSGSGTLTFSHTMQAYAEESWYFLSDREAEPYQMPESATISPEGLTATNTFTQMLLHEQDLFCPATTGRVYLGEDFRSPASRTFNFTLTDMAAGEKARARISFATKTSGASSIVVSANGTQLPTTSSDNFSAVTSSDQFMNLRTSIKTISSPSQNLALGVSFRSSGSISLARLDYIEIEYKRLLKLRDGELYFNSTATAPTAINIDGCEASTEIWDITDPSRPSKVRFSLSGSRATFGVQPGLREFIAFTPDKGGQAITAAITVGNQNLHALPIPDMLIITPTEYVAAAERLAAHHRNHDGFQVTVLSPREIYNEFSSGTPDVSAFRRLLKMWYDRGRDNSYDSSEQGKIRYCLILSRPTYDNKQLMEVTKNAGYPRVPIWQSLAGNSKNTSYSTDDFIGMLEDCPNSFNIGSAKINVSVGRMPVTSPDEALSLVDKYINYVENPTPGEWRNHIMMIADDQDSAVHLDQSERVYSALSNNGRGVNYLYDRVYLDSYVMESSATGDTYPLAKERMLRLWNDGVSFINYIGHASVAGWGHEDLLNWRDINSFDNKNLPLLYAATCEFGRLDEDSRCGAEVLWSLPSAGIIATICPSRTVFITPNGVLSELMAKQFFNSEEAGQGRRIGDIIRDAKNSYSGADDNKLRYAIIGNPAMRFPVPKYKVKVESISGIELDQATELPVLQARGRAEIKGSLTDEEGNLISDYNGNLCIALYDAESPVETLGNGKDGVVRVYNDRRTQLYRGVTRVVNGQWSTTVLLPAEIENNHTTARFTFYAYDDKGNEAHGETSRLYVFGYDTDADEDIEGPKIDLFALNREDFTNGGVVHSSPVVLARISDESGINLSDAGIGHKITLTLDDKTYFEDVNTYYTPDPDDYLAGSLMYPLSTIEAGKHSLQLTVWDNANNSSTATLEFEVAVAKAPEIYELFTDVNPAREKVNFTLSTDRPMAKINCLIEVFDLNGRRVWSNAHDASTDILASVSVPWNLTDRSGVRVPRGIYLYRATITSENGTSTTETRKLAVAAQ